MEKARASKQGPVTPVPFRPVPPSNGEPKPVPTTNRPSPIVINSSTDSNKVPIVINSSTGTSSKLSTDKKDQNKNETSVPSNVVPNRTSNETSNKTSSRTSNNTSSRTSNNTSNEKSFTSTKQTISAQSYKIDTETLKERVFHFNIAMSDKFSKKIFNLVYPE